MYVALQLFHCWCARSKKQRAHMLLVLLLRCISVGVRTHSSPQNYMSACNRLFQRSPDGIIVLQRVVGTEELMVTRSSIQRASRSNSRRRYN